MGHKYSLNVKRLDDLVSSSPVPLPIPVTSVRRSAVSQGGLRVGAAPNTSFSNPNPIAEENGNDPGFLSRVFDVISRPRYAALNVVKDMIDPGPNTDNPFESIGAGLMGIDKTSGADVIRAADDFVWKDSVDISNEAAGALGLGLDLAGDPLNFVPGSWFAAGAKGVSKGLGAVSDVLKGAKKTEAAIKSGEGITRYTAEEAASKGLGTQTVHHGDIVENIPKAPGDHAPNIPTVEYPLGSEYNPRSDTANPVMGELGQYENARTNNGGFATPFNPDLATPNPESAVYDLAAARKLSESMAATRGVTRDKANPFEPDVSSPSTGFTQAQNDMKGPPVGVRDTGGIYVDTPNPQTTNRAKFITTAQGMTFREGQNLNPIVMEPKRAAIGSTGMKELPPGRSRRDIAQQKLEAAANPVADARLFEASPGWDTKFNDIPQSYEMQQITRELNDSIKTSPEAFKTATGRRNFAAEKQYKYVGIMNGLRDAKAADLARGKAPVVSHAGQRYMLHMSDVVDSIPVDDFIRAHMNMKSGVVPSQFIHGGAAAIHASNEGLTGVNAVSYIYDTMKSANKAAKPASQTELHRLAEAIYANTDKLKYHLVKNEQIVTGTGHEAGKYLGSSQIKEIVRDLQDPLIPSSKELVRVADLYGIVNRSARAAGMTPGETMAAVDSVREATHGVVDVLDVAAARDTLAGVKMAQRGNEVGLRARDLEQYKRDAYAMSRISEQNARDFTASMARNVKPGEAMAPPPDIYADLADRETNDFLNGIQRRYGSVRQKFIYGAEQGKFAGVRNRNERAFGAHHASFQHDLQRLEKEFGRKAIDETFAAIWAKSDPHTLAKDLRPVYDQLYPKIKDWADPVGDFASTFLLRSGVGIDGFNAMAKARGIPFVELKAAYEGEPLMTAWLRSYKDLKIKDPMDFMARFHGVAADAAVLGAMARHAESYGSKAYKAGHSKIARSVKFDDAPVSHFIDNEMWIPDNIIEQLRRMNNEMLKPINWGKQDTPFAKFMNKVFDPLTRVWKMFATTMRPGHHGANIAGDTATNFLAGVKPNDYLHANEALRAIGLVGKQQYEHLAKALTGEGIPAHAYKGSAAAEHAFDVTLKDGTVHKLSNGQAGEALYRNGAISDFRVLEDIEEASSTAGINAFTEKIINTRYGRVMEKVSEWNANNQRAAQAINMMRNPKFTKQFDNIDDAWGAAIEESLKAHPDAGGLTAFEKKWGRRVIPFYSYNRQILPWVAMNFLSNPRRAMVIPKAQYNLLIAAGQDPESMDYPYTNDSVLPPWALGMLSGNIQGETPESMNFGYSLSSPLDTLSDWTNAAGQGGNPLPQFGKQLVSSVNPLITLPFDIYNPKNDKSEQIDERIPGGSTFKSVTGISPAGSIGNILSGTPAIDETRQVQQGKKTMLFNESLANFFLGLKLQDFSDYSGVNQPTVRTSSR